MALGTAQVPYLPQHVDCTRTLLQRTHCLRVVSREHRCPTSRLNSINCIRLPSDHLMQCARDCQPVREINNHLPSVLITALWHRASAGLLLICISCSSRPIAVAGSSIECDELSVPNMMAA